MMFRSGSLFGASGACALIDTADRKRAPLLAQFQRTLRARWLLPK
jgi:hypothetical protein